MRKKQYPVVSRGGKLSTERYCMERQAASSPRYAGFSRMLA